MTASLVFISGASSGIGAAMARSVPFEDARVINISRSKSQRCEDFLADLSDPDAWKAVAELFVSELRAFRGERVVFVHCAGTLDPIGFAGEVPGDRYTDQVLLNSASPQVLGEAFLHAARETEAPCVLLFIGSGAATNIYEGWSAYGPGKAAVNQWVRTVGAEQQRRSSRCKVLSVAPGIVETPMQEQIRAVSENEFPVVDDFIGYHDDGGLRDPDVVARELWKLLEEDVSSGSVIDLRDPPDAH